MSKNAWDLHVEMQEELARYKQALGRIAGMLDVSPKPYREQVLDMRAIARDALTPPRQALNKGKEGDGEPVRSDH